MVDEQTIRSSQMQRVRMPKTLTKLAALRVSGVDDLDPVRVDRREQAQGPAAVLQVGHGRRAGHRLLADAAGPHPKTPIKLVPVLRDEDTSLLLAACKAVDSPTCATRR
jgi:hypothetical protein